MSDTTAPSYTCKMFPGFVGTLPCDHDECKGKVVGEIAHSSMTARPESVSSSLG